MKEGITTQSDTGLLLERFTRYFPSDSIDEEIVRKVPEANWGLFVDTMTDFVFEDFDNTGVEEGYVKPGKLEEPEYTSEEIREIGERCGVETDVLDSTVYKYACALLRYAYVESRGEDVLDNRS